MIRATPLSIGPALSALLFLGLSCGGQGSTSSDAGAGDEALLRSTSGPTAQRVSGLNSFDDYEGLAGRDASLSSLALSGVALDSAFQPTVTQYTASARFLDSSVTVTPIATDSAASVSVNGVSVSAQGQSNAIELLEGNNRVDVLVVAADGTTTETYTVTINRPTAHEFVQQGYLKASNADALDELGNSIAISGDTLVVGVRSEDGNAPFGEDDNTAVAAGAAFVFVRDGAGWSQQAYLKASNAEADDWFGTSVAIDGDTLVVGAVREDSSAFGGEDDNSTERSGAAYVFVRDGASWTQQAFLKASNAEAIDGFGWYVGISGDTVAVSARFEDSSALGGEADNSEGDSGAVYVFVRDGTSWSQQGFLKASNAGAGDWFGYGLAIDEDTVVVGAFREDSGATGGENDNSAVEAGAAYVFLRDGTHWSQQAYIKGSNTEAGDLFGVSVAVSGETVVVGAGREASSALGGQGDNSAARAGAAYIFVRDAGHWSQQALLKASNAEAGDEFGWRVAIDGDHLVAGAWREDGSASGGEGDNSAELAGATYVFTRNGMGWTQQAYLKSSNADAGDQFGNNVAISGDTVAIAAWKEDGSPAGNGGDNSVEDAGAAYVWR